jgi:EAL domain-containing protein (putative c-di-GMP-specific phosphodiesterase class I)
MGRSLDMRVVAEGVETKEQAAYLESIWCQHAQGYLYRKPLPADEFAAWVRSRGVPHSDPEWATPLTAPGTIRVH